MPNCNALQLENVMALPAEGMKVRRERRSERGLREMRRGGVVTVATAGDHGKPRPAVIVQTDALPVAHASAVVCQMTSECSDTEFRVAINPGAKNGLRAAVGALWACSMKFNAVRRCRKATAAWE